MESKQTSKLLQFGEITLWIGVFIISSSVLTWWPVDGSVEPDIHHQYLALLEWHSSVGEEFR